MACKNQTHRMNHTKEQTPQTFLIRCFLYLLLSLLLLLLLYKILRILLLLLLLLQTPVGAPA